MIDIVTDDIIRAAEDILRSRKFSRDDTDYKMARGMIGFSE